MKISSAYLDLLRTTQPPQIAAYLAANGWRETYQEENRYSLWDKKFEGVELEQIILPLNTQFGDYADRVQDILRIMSEDIQDEEKSILSRIRNSSFEIVRLLVEQDDFRNGTLPISGGIALFQNARGLLLASACSTVERRPTHRDKKPTEALEFMKEVRLGQSILGSYGISLLVPIKQEHQAGSTPFPRRVTTTLMKSLSSIMDLVQSDTPFDKDRIVNSIETGVNAELLDSLSTIINRTNADNLTIQIDQSLDSSTPFDAPHSIKIPSYAAGYFRDISTSLRGDAIIIDRIVRGFITKIFQERDETLGKVVIKTNIGNAQRNVQVEFADERSYQMAISAFQHKGEISFKGDLLVQNKRYQLIGATVNF